MEFSTPQLSCFPTYPASWYFVTESRALERSPHAIHVAGERVVVFRTQSGEAKALAASCPHMGAPLDRGSVVGERLRCAFHGWQFDGAGRCSESHARARIFATAERYGGVFVYAGERPLFALPEFEDESLRLCSARPFHIELETPWFMIAAQSFDLRHFREIHDRILIDEPVVESPSPHARRVTCRLRVAGESLMNRATRFVSGDEAEFQMTIWAGNIVLVRCSFSRDRTYGFVVTTPIDERRVRVTIIANAAESQSSIARWLLDPIRVRVKRAAIRSFASHDIPLLDGLEYRSHGLDGQDREIVDYLRWLAATSQPDLMDIPQHERSTISCGDTSSSSWSC
jgi:phenylpropionate dioxygenase-like ring-hydroxylating dioxygenase large terminal subunit